MEIIFCDNHILVVSKQAGVSTQPHEGLSDSLLDKAKAYYNSPDYTETKKLRAGAADARFVAVDGFDPAAWAGVVADSEALVAKG